MRKAVGDSVNMQQIAPGISIDHFVPGEKNVGLLNKYNLQNKLVIICVGRLVHRKGQDRLIQAMPKIVNQLSNAHLVIVGEGPRGAHLKKLVAKNQLENSVTFVGRVSYDQLPMYLQLGDVFAMPARSRFFGLEVEGLGIVYLEASSCGLPVIAGASGGAPDAVLQGESGLVVDGNDPCAIASSVLTLLQDAELRGAMSKRGREWAQSQWSWKIWGKRFSQLLLGQDS
jgi:phosphatidylinositol alpha-1,6-mannosyltransferase